MSVMGECAARGVSVGSNDVRPEGDRHRTGQEPLLKLRFNLKIRG